MSRLSHAFSNIIAMLLISALAEASAPLARARTLTPEAVHARIAKRGLGNWVGIELDNGTAFAGRIVGIGEDSFSLQLHNDPAATPVFYRGVIRLHTGVSRVGFWALTVAGFGGVAAMAAIGMHELHRNEAKMPTVPSAAPMFP